MARTVNTAARAVRREAFVDVAQHLIQTRGYEQMSIQDVLDALNASRGAFYHYFDSKQALLEAVVDRFAQGALASLTPMLDDSSLSASQKLEALFGGIARWKNDRKDFTLALLAVWVSDENALWREKLRHSTTGLLAPMLERILREGIDEGVFTVGAPDATARAMIALLLGFQDMAVDLFLARQAGSATFEDVQRCVTAFTNAVERILGAPAGSLTLADQATLRLWFG
jgi:AcrR family transcriptional regulator